MIALLAIPVICGVLQALAGCWLVLRFVQKPVARVVEQPPVSVLKPLHGNEPMLEAALATLCEQAYPNFQVVFGVQDAADPAADVVRRLRARFPSADMELVIDPTGHGSNRKVNNLINMLPHARHDVLVIADSDVHAPADYLLQLVGTLQQQDVGLATTLYAGLPAAEKLAANLGAMQITHVFLPGALLARALGRQDCLGATMALRRQDLMCVGGFHALVNHLADDQVLGRRIAALGLRVALAGTVVHTTVPETRLRELFRHELRWSRTIRTLEPRGFAASVLQYPLAWALLAVALSGGALWSVGVLTTAWLLRAAAAVGVDHALNPPLSAGSEEPSFSCPLWLWPVRDVLSIVVMIASYGGRHVVWRGHGLEADTPQRHIGAAPQPFEGSQTR